MEVAKVIRNHNTAIKEGIAVKNAGIVLLSDFIFILFERLNLVQKNQFINKESQTNAVQYLQYTITGQTATEEMYLPLTKILCGLSLTDPVPAAIEISETSKNLIDGLIIMAISHWNSIESSSVEGFRDNWLIREGVLLELEDKWELTVDKRSYDLLIQRYPFSFSVIRYPWMKKPLHVNWSY